MVPADPDDPKRAGGVRTDNDQSGERTAAAVSGDMTGALKRTLVAVVLLNLGYFFVEFYVARAIGSVSLFADSVDFLEDASINVMVLIGLGLAAGARRLIGMGLAGVILVPGIAALLTIYQKIMAPEVPDPVLLTMTGAGALAVNASCAFLLARVRLHGGSLTRAAFLSARNDVAANIAIIVAGGLTYWTGSIWPDVIVGLGIAAMNADAAREVFEAAQGETDDDDGDGGGSVRPRA